MHKIDCKINDDGIFLCILILILAKILVDPKRFRWIYIEKIYYKRMDSSLKVSKYDQVKDVGHIHWS